MRSITRGSKKTTWAFFVGALMVALPEIMAAVDAADKGTDVNWWQVGLAAAIAIAGYLTRDDSVTSEEAGAGRGPQ